MARIRLAPLLPFLCLMQALALAQYTAYDYGFDVKTRIKRNQLDRRTGLVVRDKTATAAAAAAGDVVEVLVRPEIRQLEQDTDLWTLYILGLSMMQFTDQASPTSYYGLAVAGNENTGYCTHSSVLFPTWHRPYMALYEQVLHGLIETIASFWPEGERERYVAAARRFRLPYWDWAATPPAGESVLPRSIGGSPFIDINGPSGQQRIANPLFSYSFKPLDSTAFGSGPSNNSFVATNLDQNRPSIAQRLYALFSSYDNYTTFSNNAFGAQADSIESLHDTIHSLVGGFGPGQPSSPAGHMAFIQWSAFDPIFFLHHCMVDRVLAIWQTLHPDSWVTPSRALTNSYTIRRGQTLSSTTSLAPFFSNENGSLWDSDGVRDHTKFGYTYAELVHNPKANQNDNQNNKMAQIRTAKQAVNRMYGSFSPASLFLKEIHEAGIKAGPNTPARNRKLPRSATATKLFVGDHYHEWTANVRIAKQAVADASAVHFFLGGAPPHDPREWTAAPNHVGSMGVFASTAAAARSYAPSPAQELGGKHHGAGNHDVAVSGTVPLTAALVKMVAKGELASLEPEDVEGFLRGRLRMRVLGKGGEVVAPGEGCVKGVGVEIVSSLVAAPWSEEELPKWGEERIRH
ncbi:hypothetical protein NEMBOFW57_003015 [Staphylotrichum longicolle]|uniref:Tyrosinase copper-binding domain-containing protein n=1 Tax=Staphylotrichum longicolle TaxID=669026 RepID=A0AAD4F5E3_9PEZI|nr:hypothetical protein NEMBOFW57_003015 [Staphylotrichum longicolle]